jgi:hypothetical protein
MSQPKITPEQLSIGSGSGLDADTLDGQNSSAFASASHTHPEYETSNLDVYAALAAISTTGVGSLTLAKASSTQSLGTTISGASLVASDSNQTSGYGSYVGTWRCLGHSGNNLTTLWVRIS